MRACAVSARDAWLAAWLAAAAAATLAAAGAAAAAPAGPSLQWSAALRTGEPSPDAGAWTSFGTPVLDRGHLIVRASAGDDEHGVVGHQRFGGATEWLLRDGDFVPTTAAAVEDVGLSPYPFTPAISAHRGRVALTARRGAGPTRVVLQQPPPSWGESADWVVVAQLGGGAAASIPGPWPADGEWGWPVPAGVAALFELVEPPYVAASQAAVPHLFRDRTVLSVVHEGRLYAESLGGAWFEQALLRTAPAGPTLSKVADPWYPHLVSATPEGFPILRQAGPGSAGAGALVWRDYAEVDSDALGGLYETHRIRLAAQGAYQTLLTGSRTDGKATGNLTPGNVKARFVAFEDDDHLGLPVVDPAGAATVFWAQSQAELAPVGQPPKLFQGVYRAELSDGVTYRLVDTQMAIVGSPGAHYEWLSEPSTQGLMSVVTGRFTPAGEPAPREALLLFDRARLMRLLTTGEMVDGREVASIRTSQQALQGSTIAVWLGFADGSEGVYLVDFALPCRVDLTGSSSPLSPAYGVPDGVRNRADLLYYEQQYAAAAPAADVTSTLLLTSAAYGVPDGTVGLLDRLWFRHHYYVVGCK